MKIRAVMTIGLGLVLAAGVSAKAKVPSLKQAVQYCNAAKVKELLDQGADANEKDAGMPMLMVAARTANCEIMKMLIDKGAVVEATNAVGMTALCGLALDSKEPEEMVKANAAGNEKVLEAFRKRGNEAAAKDWLMPGDPALYSSVADRAKLLVEAGANPNFVWGLEMTPFLQAVKSQNLPLVKALLATGKVDPELRFHQWAEKVVGVAKFIDVAKYTDRKTAQDWALVPQYDTPLLFAAEKGDLALVQILVEGGANLNNGKKQEGSNFSGNTHYWWVAGPLDIAKGKGHLDVVEYLKSKGAVEIDLGDHP